MSDETVRRLMRPGTHREGRLSAAGKGGARSLDGSAAEWLIP
jgi:hypothetical protein